MENSIKVKEENQLLEIDMNKVPNINNFQLEQKFILCLQKSI